MTPRRRSPLVLLALVLLAPRPARAGSEPAAPPPARAADAGEPRHEMVTYVVGFLRRGPAWTAEATDETRRLQAGHMANIRAMADAGKLLVAGPFQEGDDLRGLFVFHPSVTIDEAQALVARDPAVQAERLRLELRRWWAAKGLRVDPPAPAADAAR